MGVEVLMQSAKPQDLQLVSVKLPTELVKIMRNIRKTTGRTNTEVYTELLKEGVIKFREAAGLTKTGKKRGRPAKNGKPAKKKKTKKAKK